MATIITRQTAGGGATVKGSPLTNTEMDNNLININVGITTGAAITGGTIDGVSIGATTPSTGKFTSLTTNQTTFNLINATATTLNIGGAATTLSIGAATGTLTINNAGLVHNSTSYTKVAVGTDAQRPGSPSAGMIRYNSDIGSFEGYGSAWASLGGVKSVDGLTYIIAETSPGASNDELEFYAADSSLTTTKVGGWNQTRLLSNTPINVSVNSSTDAVRITQTGSGNAFVVEDSANPDATPFVIDANGFVIKGTTGSVTTISGTGGIQSVSQGTSVNSGFSAITSVDGTGSSKLAFSKTRANALASATTVLSGDDLGRIIFEGYDGSNFLIASQITSAVDGTPGTNDMPGRLVFSTTADGASSPTERMRINSAGEVGIGAASVTGYSLNVSKSLTGATTAVGINSSGAFQSDVTGSGVGFRTNLATAASAFTLTNLIHYTANQGTIGATSAVTNQYGFNAASSLTGATNNYGFYSNIASGTGRWNFYASGTADNYFAGNTTIAGTTTLGATLQTGLGVSTGSALIELGNQRTGDGNAYIDFHSVAGGDYQARILKSGGANSTFNITNEGTGILALNQVGAGVITFNTNGSERMRVNSVGQIAVSATGSASAPVISKSDDLNTGIFFPAADTIAFAEGGTESMRIDSSGNVGIGTNSPSTYGKLAVEGISQAIVARSGTANYCEIAVQSGSTDAVKGQFQAIEGTTNKVIIGSRTNHPLAFNVADTERMRIDSSGNVGIGGASTGSLLHLTQNGNTTAFISATNSGTNSAGITLENAGQRNWNIWADRATDTFRIGNNSRGTTNITLDSAGKVGIGTTPAVTSFEVNGGIRARGGAPGANNANNNGFAFTGGGDSDGGMYSSTDGQIEFYTNAQERGRFIQGFSVGTTADPGAGAIFATQNITAYYSDERLKTKISNIENAIEKVKSLNGFIYVNNDIAKANGYTSDEEQIGLSAQEVEKVLPQVVKLAPFDMEYNEETKQNVSKSGENYKTLDYSKLVPLLIEAIKEQQERIEQLEKLLIK